MLQQIYYKYVEAPLVVRILGMAVFFITLFGAAVHFIEPQTFPTIFEGIWWAVVTASTVGFGDYAPKTVAGRVLGIGLIFIGAGFLSAYFINLAAAAVTSQNTLREGKAVYAHKNHLVIVGWNERSKEIIDRLQEMPVPRHIVLIDDSLRENPYPEKVVHFIQGAPYKDETLKKANVKDAATALITSDQNKNEVYADMNAILTLVAMKGCQPSLYCVVEILTTDQVINAKRAGADEVIETNRHASSIMLNSLYFDGISHTITHLLDPLNGGHLKVMSVKEEWKQLSFRELASLLLQDRILLIGIKQGEKASINPPLDTTFNSNDELLVIKH
ncbi:potassium channel family protein [Bacillus xiapuensis]|uniref:potassium channel family protein n=1 Tax=Bacillus xiapuensis TaxID=2014075 RepID=UPI000C241304|nr:potassium channel family protein [Bacillus xiapuensis]